MTLGQCDRIANTTTASADGDSRLVDTGSSDEEVIRRLEISGPLFVQLLYDLWGGKVEARATALPEAAIVDGKRVNTLLAEFLCYRLPRLPNGVAHVQQQHARAGLGRGEECRAQLDAVGSENVDVF